MVLARLICTPPTRRTIVIILVVYVFVVFELDKNSHIYARSNSTSFFADSFV